MILYVYIYIFVYLYIYVIIYVHMYVYNIDIILYKDLLLIYIIYIYWWNMRTDFGFNWELPSSKSTIIAMESMGSVLGNYWQIVFVFFSISNDMGRTPQEMVKKLAHETEQGPGVILADFFGMGLDMSETESRSSPGWHIKGGAPQVISWFVNPIKYRCSIINLSYSELNHLS